MAVEIMVLTEAHEAGLRALVVGENWRQFEVDFFEARHRPWERIYVAVLDSAVVGFIEGTFSDSGEFDSGELPPPRARIMNLLVDSLSRREGVGTALMHQITKDAVASTLQAVVLYADPRDSAGRMAFFARCGFRRLRGTEMLGAELGTVVERTT
ncbi:GNAT family N-acetyltransferase [Streptomyces sp. NPDC008139]|uniref:GNAT family N-acetyltransferase n=1 Tax=Streptomyces sp. NPDC008139 TaxID=3364814 RepID=UPI0036EEE5ED